MVMVIPPKGIWITYFYEEKEKDMKTAVGNMLMGNAARLLNLLRKPVKGDSHFLAVAVVMIIVVVIAALFRTQLLTIFGDVFTQLDTAVDNLF